MCNLAHDLSLNERVQYINDIRLRMFGYYIATVGILTGFLVQKANFGEGDIFTSSGFSLIGLIAFIVFLCSFCLFVFDLWAIARLRATTTYMLDGDSSNSVTHKKKSTSILCKFDEDLWIATPAMIINSAIAGGVIFTIFHSCEHVGKLCTIVFLFFLIGHAMLNIFVPQKLAESLGPYADSMYAEANSNGTSTTPGSDKEDD